MKIKYYIIIFIMAFLCYKPETYADTPKDPYYSINSNNQGLEQWNLNVINMPQAWDIETGNANINVAVIDWQSFDRKHEDLKDVFITGYHVATGETGMTAADYKNVNVYGETAVSLQVGLNRVAYYLSMTGHQSEALNILITANTLGFLADLVIDYKQIFKNESVLPEMDYAYHGTCTAGIIGAKRNNKDSNGNYVGIAGIAGGDENNQGVKIMPVQLFPNTINLGLDMFTQYYVLTSPALAKGIIWAADNGADVINMSIGGLEGANGLFPRQVTELFFGYKGINMFPGNPTVKDAIEYAYKKGCVLVASAGNGSMKGTIDLTIPSPPWNIHESYDVRGPVIYPACDPHVIAVGATNEQDKLDSQSSYGPEVAVVAPGTPILTTDVMGLQSGDNREKHNLGDTAGNYNKAFGLTSAAAPHIAGVAALIRSIIPKAHPEIVRYIIKASADKNLGETYDPGKHGAGRLNAYKALKLAKSYEWTCFEKDVSFNYDSSIWIGNNEKWFTTTFTNPDPAYTPVSWTSYETEKGSLILDRSESLVGNTLNISAYLGSYYFKQTDTTLYVNTPGRYRRKFYIICSKPKRSVVGSINYANFHVGDVIKITPAAYPGNPGPHTLRFGTEFGDTVYWDGQFLDLGSYPLNDFSFSVYRNINGDGILSEDEKIYTGTSKLYSDYVKAEIPDFYYDQTENKFVVNASDRQDEGSFCTGLRYSITASNLWTGETTVISPWGFKTGGIKKYNKPAFAIGVYNITIIAEDIACNGQVTRTIQLDMSNLDAISPTVPALTIPADDSIVNNPKPSFTWGSANDTGGTGVATYDLEISNDNTFTEKVNAIVTGFSDWDTTDAKWHPGTDVADFSAGFSAENDELYLTPAQSGGSGMENNRYKSFLYYPEAPKDVVITSKVTMRTIGDNQWSLTGIFAHGVGKDDFHKWGLGFRFLKESNKYKLTLFEEGLDDWIRDQKEFYVEQDQAYWLKMKVVGNQVWGKAWKADGIEKEPVWMLKGNFTQNINDNAIGVFTHNYVASFNDIKVEPVNLLFNCDFTSINDTSKWTSADISKGWYWGSDGAGGGIYYVNDDKGVPQYSSTGDKSWGDYSASVRIQPRMVDKWCSALRVRIQDPNNSISINSTNDGIRLYKTVNGIDYDYTFIPKTIHQNEWHTLRVDCIKDKVLFYYNNEFLYVGNSPWQTGYIALATWPRSPIQMFFDDVKVEKLNSSTEYIPSTNLSDGTYYWHVRAVDYAGNLSPWSGYRTLTINTQPPSAAPTLSKPLYDQVCTELPDLEWNTVSGASKYQVDVSDIARLESFYSETLNDNFNDGRYDDVWSKPGVTPASPATWEAADGELSLTKLGTTDGNSSGMRYLNYVYHDSYLQQDVIMTAKVTVNGFTQNHTPWSCSGIFARGTGTDYKKWALCFRGNDTLALLDEWGPDENDWKATTPFDVEVGVPYYFKLKVTGNDAWGKVWKVGDSEPADWLIYGSFPSGDDVLNKAVGFFSHDDRVSFDDVRVLDGISPEPMISEIVTDTQYTMPAKPDDRYFWRVRAIDSAGNPGPWTQESIFDLSIHPPEYKALSAGPNEYITDETPTIDASAQSNIAGLNTSSGRYDYTTDSGETWTSVLGDDFNGDVATKYWNFVTVGVNCEYSINSGKLTLIGGGKLWASDDNYTAISTQSYGNNIEAVAKVVNMDTSDSYNKAGIMIRNESSLHSAGYCYIGVSPAYGWTFQYDLDNNGTLDHKEPSGGTSTFPCYVKLIKEGTKFGGYYSIDGSSWTQIGSTITLTSAQSSQVLGMAIGNENSNTEFGATFDYFTVNTDLGHIPTCTGANGTQNVETITAHDVPFNNISSPPYDQNRIRFYVTDMYGRTAISPDTVVKITSSDSTPPEAIDDLRVYNNTDGLGSVNLSWSAPGDDGNTGVLTGKYKIQYSTYSANMPWSPATANLVIPISNVAPGSKQQAVITGLNQLGNYYFKVWSSDELNNLSDASNLAAIYLKPITEFVCTIKETGGDYNNLSAWNAANKCDLVHSTGTRVFAHGGLTGTINDNTTVTGQTSSATGIATHVTATQALIKNISGVFQSGETVSCSAGNFTLSDDGSGAAAVAKIDGNWDVADTTATITGWQTSPVNYIKIYTTPAARHPGKWDLTKYRISAEKNYSTVFAIAAPHVYVDGLQIENTAGNPSANREMFREFYTTAPASGEFEGQTFYREISNNYIRYAGSTTANRVTGMEFNTGHATGTYIAWNNIIEGCGTGIQASYGTSGSTFCIYNNTIILKEQWCYGVHFQTAWSYTQKFMFLYLRNNLIQGSTNCYHLGSENGLFKHTQNNISSDNTTPDYDFMNKTVSFVNAGANEYFLTNTDTFAKDAGVSLLNDAWRVFDTDIQGETRPAGGGWDIGADEMTDFTAPSAIANLNVVTGDKTGEIILSWFAPGDDGMTGNLDNGQFRIEYSTSSQIQWNMQSAQVTISTNCAPETSQTCRITGLQDQTTYYFRVWSADDVKNYSEASPVSNWCLGPREFICTIKENSGTGVDYTGLNAWNVANKCDLAHSTGTRVFTFNNQTGLISDGSTVWGAVSGSTGTAVHVTSSQILVKNIKEGLNGGFISGEQVYKTQNSSYVVISDGGSPAIAVAKIDGTWNQAEVVIGYPYNLNLTGWDTSPSNYIRIYTTAAARHSGKWDITKYRLVNSSNQYNGAIYVAQNHVRIDGLQLENSMSSTWNGIGIRLAGKASDPTLADIELSNNYVRYTGTDTPITVNSDCAVYPLTTSTGTVKIWNNIMTGFGNAVSQAWAGVGPNTYIIYNNTFINCDRVPDGAAVFFSVQQGNPTKLYLKNNLIQGTTKCFYSYYLDTNNFYHSNNITNDNTSPDSGYRDKTVNFVDSANGDYHLATGYTVAKDTGTDLSNDPVLAFSTDIDGDARTSGSAWDIGADEMVNNVAPSAVADLSASSALELAGKANLSWTTSGDDNSTGEIINGKYRISYSTYSAYNFQIQNYNLEITTTVNPGLSVKYAVTGLTQETTYYFHLWSGDGALNWSGISNQTSSYAPDLTAPANITTLQAVSYYDSNKITLSWISPGDDAWTNNLTGGTWRIDYSTYSSYTFQTQTYKHEQAVACAPLSEISYSITGLAGETTYYFKIWALDESSNYSEMSNLATTYLPAAIAPSAITDLQATSTGLENGQALLSWTSSGNDGLTGNISTGSWRVDYSTYSEYSFQVQTFKLDLPANCAPLTLTSHLLQGLNYGVTYYFRIWSSDDYSNYSGISNSATACPETDTTAPAQIAVISAQTDTQIRLTWTTPGDDGTIGTIQSGTWNIEYSTAVDFNTYETKTIPANVYPGTEYSYILTGLPLGEVYYLKVRTADEAQNWSGWSDTVSASAGSFYLAWQSSETLSTQSITWCDYDNDGYQDFVTGNYQEPIKVFRNNQDGTFTNIWSSSSTDNTTSIVWGDYNNDGKPDILAGNYGQPLKIYRNNGDTTFTYAWVTTESWNTQSVAFSDCDNDGKTDIVSGNYQQPVVLYRNNGDGTFGIAWQSAESGYTTSIALGDYDNDGYLDLVAGNSSENNKIYKNNKDGSFSDESISIPNAEYTTCVSWSDYNHDGKLDLFVGNYSGPDKIYRNDGNDVFTAVWTSSETAYTNNVSWGDYDNDGDLDILLSDYSNQNYIYKNNSDSTFTKILSGTQSTSRAAIWGDYDNDGDLDQLIGNSFGQPVQINKSIQAEYGNQNTAPVVSGSGYNSQYNTETGVLELTCANGSDTQTPQNGLNYEFRCATETITDNLSSWILSPLTGSSMHGFISASQPGLILDPPIENATYYWQVRVVDSGFKRSDWSGTQSIFVPGVAPSETDLSVVSRSSSAISLAWAAPGDDGQAGLLGAGSKFEINYSSYVSMEPYTQILISTVSVPGTINVYSINSLPQGAEWYLKLRTIDDKQTHSDWSSAISTKTYNCVSLASGIESAVVFYDTCELEAQTTAPYLIIESTYSTLGAVAVSSAQVDNLDIISSMYNVLPAGAAFNSVSEMTVKYDPARIPFNIDENNIDIYRFNSESGWQSMVSSIISRDPANNTLKISVNSAGLYAVISAKDLTAPSAVTTLSASIGLKEGEINLSWSSPGDDGLTGQIVAGKFRVDYSTYSEYSFQIDNYKLEQTTSCAPYSSNTLTITGLSYATTHYFAVWSYDEVGNASGISNIAESESQIEDLIAPDVPSLSSPAVHVCVFNQTPQFSWQAVTDLSVPVQYGLQISSSTDFTTLTLSTSGLFTANFIPPEDLASGVYYWQVRAKDSKNNTSDWSSYMNLEISTKGIVLVYPGNNDTVNSQMPEFRWENITSFDGVTYVIQINPGIWQTGLTTNSYKPAQVLNGGSYEWQVWAKDSMGYYAPYSGFATVTIDSIAVSIPINYAYAENLDISPNNDGVLDTSRINVNVAGTSHLNGWISNSVLVKGLYGDNNWATYGSTSAVWNGKDSAGNVVPDGEYKYNVLGVKFNSTINTTAAGVVHSGNQIWATGAGLTGYDIETSSCIYNYELEYSTNLTGITADTSGNLYFGTQEGRVYRYDGDYSPLDGIGQGLNDITIDSAGNYLYAVGDFDKVVKITAGDPPSSPQDIITSGLNNPAGVCADSDYLYVSDSGNNLIKKYQINSPYNLVWSSGTGLNNPRGIKAYKDYLFVTNTGNSEIQVYNKNTGDYAGKFCSDGIYSSSASWKNLKNPSSIDFVNVDGQDYIYIADQGNNRLQKYEIALVTGPINVKTTPPSTITTLAAQATEELKQIKLSWTAPLTLTNAQAGTYKIQYSNNVNIVWSTTTAQVTMSTSDTNTGDSQEIKLDMQNAGSTYYFRIWSFDSLGNCSDVSSTASLYLVDSIAPSAITNLYAAAGTGGSEIELSWLSPGDDAWTNNLTGTYKIQFSTFSEVQWGAGSAQVTISTSNVVPGSAQKTAINGLKEAVTYYFSVWSADKVSNWSGISNTDSVYSSMKSPGVITALSVATGEEYNKVELAWVSPGNDVYDNTLNGKYKIQYSTYSSVFWSTASASVEISTSNINPGQNQKWILAGLAEDVTYYFKIWTADESENWSQSSPVSVWYWGPREFVSKIMQTGGDFSSLSAWETAVECDLAHSTGTRVFAHGGLNGTISDGAIVIGALSGSTGTVCHVTGTQVLLRNISGGFKKGEIIYYADPNTNYAVLSDIGSGAIAVAEIDGNWDSEDTSSVNLNGFSASNKNYIKIYTTPFARHAGKWSINKYRLRNSSSNGALVIPANVSRAVIDGLQVESYHDMSAGGDGDGIRVAMTGASAVSDIQISNCLINYSGEITPRSSWTSNSKLLGISLELSTFTASNLKIFNNTIWGFGRGIYYHSWTASDAFTDAHTMAIYNNTLYNTDRDTSTVFTPGAFSFYDSFSDNVKMYLKNNLVQGTTKCYSTISFTVFEHSNNLSNDNTSPDTTYRGLNALFKDAGNSDFHLLSVDTCAVNKAVDLSNDAYLAFSTDIDGNSRPFGGTWDIGADEMTDYIAPAAITDLCAYTETNTYGKIVLSWTSPGNDGTVGSLVQGCKFKIQYSTIPVVWASQNAQIIISTNCPALEKQAFTIPGLIIEATYYLRIWAVDETNNCSELSNGATTWVDYIGGVGMFSNRRGVSGPDPAFKLGDVYAYPNPAKGSYDPTIHVEVGIADSVEINIYNVAAELVHSDVVTGAPGVINNRYAYEYKWQSDGVASGVYIYYINAKKQGESNIRVVKKLAIIR